ncbi:MAG TPA: zinc ribbon domain-containing protein [Opitutaceae bacterium]|nr:zinc ribbon domain-containing protein [Opitutaceae bacterium]
MSAFVPPGDCPACGEPVPAGARACPHCGSDERTGWSEETYLDGVDLPAEPDDGECRRIEEREIGDGLPRGGRAWLAVGLAVLLALVLSGAWWLL